MALIHPTLKGNKIVLTAPGKKPIEFSVEVPTTEKINCR
jgi:hypothetical protein